jgi:adenylate cyclase
MSGHPSGAQNGRRIERRLAAVAFVDIVGYSVLMGRDETRTHQRWMSILDDIVRPQTAQHRGSIVKSTGDGVLTEFPSVLDAVEWAQSVQQSVTAGAVDSETQFPPISLRISVHLGDLITTEFDVFGDGVNLAARLQEFAPAGGIVISEAVHDLVRGSLGTAVRDLGLVELKHFDKPVHAYVLDPHVPGIEARPTPKSDSLPSIAVLPLRNDGGDPADEYFSDGIVEDLTLSLAGLHEITVISRGSTLAYRGRGIDPREVGRSLGVRYVLSGSVRKSERLVRVSVELSDAGTGASLWGEKAEVSYGELFDVQDRLVRRIVAGIAPNVRAAELRAAMRKRPQNVTAYDHTLRALHVIHALDARTFMQAREYLNQAMEADPEFALPFAWAARWHNLHIGQGWSTNPEEDNTRALELAARAIELDRNNALALATYGHLRSYLMRDYASAMVYFERALAAGPNSSIAWVLSSGTLSYLGRGEEAVRHAQHGLELSPFDHSLFYSYMFLALAHYTNGSFEEAVKWGRLSLIENGSYTSMHKIQIAALVAHGNMDGARAVAASMMKLEPRFSLAKFEDRLPIEQPMRAQFVQRMREAGLPE